MSRDNYIKAIDATLEASDLKAIVSDATELGIDTLLAEGALKDIPIIGTMMNVKGAISSIRDHLFARKVVRFLTPIADINPIERKVLIAEIQQRNSNANLGETVLHLIEKSDNEKTAEAIGVLFRALMDEKIDLRSFRIAGSTINRNSFDELWDFVGGSGLVEPISSANGFASTSFFKIVFLPKFGSRSRKTEEVDQFVKDGAQLSIEATYLGKKVREVLQKHYKIHQH